MSSLRVILQELVDKSFEEKLSIIRDSYKDLKPALSELDEKTKGLSFVADIIGTAASADVSYDPREITILRTVMDTAGLDFSDSDLEKILKDSGTEGVRKMVTALSDMLEPGLRGSLILMIAAVCACDDKISTEEIDLISRLVED